MTAAGTVEIQRVWFACGGCGAGGCVADDRLGVDGLISPGAGRLMSLAAAEWSFAVSAERLAEFTGIRVCDNTVRAAALEHGRRAGLWQRESPVPTEAFTAAAGDAEFSTDGTMINTLAGWREMRLFAFAKRPAGSPAEPSQWDERRLPPPAARMVFASLDSSERLGPRFRAAAVRLGIRQTRDITVLADGAKWIWKQVDAHLPGAAGVLDVYHASQHLFQCGDRLFGEGSPAGRAWAEKRRAQLLCGGAQAVLEELVRQRRSMRSPRKRRALNQPAAFLEPHRGHTDYRGRLAAGRSIGSGMIQGACKTVVGRRIKQTGARWTTRNAEAIAALCALHYGDLWNAFWSAAA